MRIAVIGSGGAGMTATWLLEDRHDVTLFERNAVLGGHAHTTDVTIGDRTYPCDDGFAWFSDRMYPLLLRLLALHAVETEIIPLGVTFTNREIGCSVPMPPTRPSHLWRLLTDPRRIRCLLGMDHAIRRGVSVVSARTHSQTLAEFVVGLQVGDQVLREFVQPFLFGAWGGPWDRSGEFAAYPVLKYPVLHRPTQLRRVRWRQVKAGVRRYIEAVARSATHARILAGTGVQSIARDDDGWEVSDSAGERHRFDHVVCAVGVREAQQLLEGVAGLERVATAVSGFETYLARVATHRDPSFMPPDRADWLPVHIDYDGHSARLSAWVGWRDGVDIFTSYVADRMPADIVHESTFSLPLVSPAHFRAQAVLAPLQGTAGLHLCGDWTQDIGSHEDAVRSAVDAVRAIDPAGDRLEQLTNGTPSSSVLASR